MAENVPISEFNQQFKASLEELLLAPGSTKELHRTLYEMVQYIGRNIAAPADTKEDLCQEVWMHAITLIPKVDARQNPSAWFRKSINRRFWRLTNIAMNDKALRLNAETISRFDVSPLTQAHAATRARTTLSPKLADFRKRIRRYLDHHIPLGVAACDDAETEAVRLDLGGQLRGMQEMRRHFLGHYKPCETATMRYTLDRAIPKSEE